MKYKSVVIVTGASRGLGASVAKWIGKTGGAVVLLARSNRDLKSVAEKIENLGGNALVLETDVSDPENCCMAVQKTIDKFSRLDTLINNAGVFSPIATVGDSDPEAWHLNIKVNLLGPYYMTKFSLPWLKKSRGRIINISSGAAQKTIFSGSAYCASKAALNHFTRVLAEEEPEITCIAMRPGVVDTRMQEFLREEGPDRMPMQQASYYIRLKTDGMLEPPVEPARSVAWLALHAPREMTGSFLDYDDPRIQKPSLEVLGKHLEMG